MTGSARAVLAAACRLARRLSLPDDSLYKSVPSTMYCDTSWLCACRSALSHWRVTSWEKWSSHSTDLGKYRAQVRRELLAASFPAWREQASRSGCRVPHLAIQSSPSSALRRVHQAWLPWDAQLAVRGWCRMRAGLPRLRAIQGKHSRAKDQNCIFCDRPGVQRGIVHALSRCPAWESWRQPFLTGAALAPSSPPAALANAILSCQPSQGTFGPAVLLVDAIDRAATAF